MKRRNKLTSWLLSLVLCFCMILAIPLAVEASATCEHVDEDDKKGYCDTCGDLMAPAQLIQTSASLEGNIAVNYFMLLSEEVQKDDTAYMEFTVGDEVIQVPASQSKLIGEYDVFTCEVAAKEMTDIITSQFYYDNGKAAFTEKPHVYNVRAYAKHVLENNSEAQALMEAMVNYGAASQTYFKYNEGDLANSIQDKDGNSLVAVPDYENVHITEFDFDRGQGTENVKLYSASLILNSETTLRLFFNGNITAAYQGKSLEVKYRGGLYYVDIVNIAAKYLDDDVTVTINDGTDNAEITFSPMSYCQLVEQDTTGSFSTEMKNLARALYLYNQAADEYFGDVVAPEGVSMSNALHYLNGDVSGTKITTQVTGVTFGRSNQYRDIVNGNAPSVLVTDQQDTPATAYYVSNSSGYDVYLLSNDDIYTPVDSNGLFRDMTAITSLNTDNLDTGRTETFTNMLRGCTALTELDASHWDMSSATAINSMFRESTALKNLNLSGWEIGNVTNARYMFLGCTNLVELDATNWDTSSVENMSAVFNNCTSLQTITGTETWDMSSCTDMSMLFNNCTSLQTLNVTGWDVSKVTNFSSAFSGCSALTDLAGSSTWRPSSATNMSSMFNNCLSLPSLDVTGWDTSDVTDMSLMFYCNKRLIAITGLNTWDMSNVTTTYGMFYRCESLQKLDNIGDWDTGKVTNMGHMFRFCYELIEVDVSNWDVSSVESMTCLFYECKKLANIDVSGWKPCSVADMSGMFNHCEVITKLDVSNWDVSKVTNFAMTFQSCNALEELNVSNWNTGSATTMGWMFWGCNSIKLLDVSNWDVSDVTVMSHMFRGCNSLLTMPVDDWDVSNVESMDALFHSCSSLTTINVSKWKTGNVREFSQMFEGCEELAEIVGMGGLDTSNCRNFDEMFSWCYALKVLDLSGWDTSSVTPGYKNENGDICRGFEYAFNAMNSVETLIMGPNVVFNGNGEVAEEHQMKLPNPAPIDGQETKWYNAANDTYYTASEIPQPNPEEGPVTYIAAVPPVNP